MKVTTLVSSGFHAARAAYPEINKSWISASFKIGGRLPNSLLMVSVQRDGELDVLLRSMEDEHATALASNSQNDILGIHYQKMLSELWAGSVYETLRLLIERKLAPSSDEFKQLAHEFRLLRIPLEKHQIAGDDKLQAPLIMRKGPAKADGTDLYEYPASRDPLRAHIMPTGLSERGSVMWQVIDLGSDKEFWLERRSLADRFLAIW